MNTVQYIDLQTHCCTIVDGLIIFWMNSGLSPIFRKGWNYS